MAIAEVGLNVLAQLLELPAGCEIEAVFYDPSRPGVIQLRLVGAGWVPTFDGYVLPKTRGLVREVLVIGRRPEITWDLPT